MTLDVVILAAGQGTRMRSKTPKVLHELAGRSLVRHVVDTAAGLESARLHVVVGHGGEAVRDALSNAGSTPDGRQLAFCEQTEQKGTGHAVAQALDGLGDGKVLVLYGDVPLIQARTLESLLEGVDEQHMALLTVTLDDPAGYGRIVRNDKGAVVAIVEHKDADARQRAIRECNTGIMAMTAEQLRRWLPELSAENAQGEYYLTDVIAMAAADGVEIKATQPSSPVEVEGVNDRRQLAALERAYQRRQADRLMAAGVSLADPQRFDLRGEVTLGRDIRIDVNVILEGRVTLEDDVVIGPNCVIKDSILRRGAVVKANSHLEGAEMGEGSDCGPFARLRPGTRLGAKAHVGNFVETKNATLGDGVKAGHLSYLGDAEIGRDTNIGAGTITCNYDGANKHRTEIGEAVFVGSNSSLVAPVTIGNGATIAAGSTITREVKDDELAIARSRQVAKQGWQRPVKTPKS
ncbi:bifunctional UDP-N-acetylglucosamine diphosphorylase/glucosamine-1-phosphate N-acetyltransferase GlmU [Salinicola sp. LHM]|uniref:bifunctional UDP-N-acetylglucosamine diphosphorylase/glucosamine-1-phosphate N-acetyltransferase GlmU n=1 Tax=Salinicola sp. LHM TaxID=3065298 RepID=UPI002ACEC313|nr:bifunctional UDP-N-acetylglucosamine diphosphorylase/glucosamine-1-phosphate N-acetyltransferase GlmU [Salinicola sp. LHM]MEC8918055.1 bifunctional UDP-N-acetylglucosamine diphosphorylase/glucosamine-1-phosphate N-acetyltransferase GlmU [Pseudomonadota bacterium]WQH33084.1 bifunctional UDP-N-acetylglucosamine diphosphorylase/glucosamine-1-phosphate N-acetyltransferase GlmU [Salinicola sp. LHM]